MIVEPQGQDVVSPPKVTSRKNLVMISGASPGEGRANADIPVKRWLEFDSTLSVIG